MRRQEVFQRRQPFAEVGSNGQRDDPTRRVGHQTAHAGQLSDRLNATLGCARYGHGSDPVDWVQIFRDSDRDVIRRPGPELDDLDVLFVFRDESAPVLAFDLIDAARCCFQDRRLLFWHVDVAYCNRHATLSCVAESQRHHVVDKVRRAFLPEPLVADAHQFVERFLVHGPIYEAQLFGQNLVEQHAANCRLDQCIALIGQRDTAGLDGHPQLSNRFGANPRQCTHSGIAFGEHVQQLSQRDYAGLVQFRLHPVTQMQLSDRHRVQVAAEPHLDSRAQVHNAEVVRQLHFGEAAEALSLSLDAGLRHGHVIAAQNHVFAWAHDRLAARRLQQIVRGEHQVARLSDRRLGEGHMHSHLVAIEVGVEGRTHQRMDLDRIPFDQHNLKRLDAEPMQRRCAVQENRAVLSDLFQHIPYFRTQTIHHALRALDVVRVVVLHQATHDERLEQFQSHAFRQSTLVQTQLGAGHDYGTPGVVDAFAQQVAAEPAMLPLQQVRQTLEFPLA